MGQKLDKPNNESELRQLQDKLYSQTKELVKHKEKPKFYGLLEVIQSETNIETAIHKVKSNKGSITAGIDGQTIKHILQTDKDELIQMIQNKINNYKPMMIKRQMIPKSGKKELRPLGIPVIIDRIIQECVRNIIEPILEAQFFEHSYGFRPMREASQAVERLCRVAHLTGYHWVVEGDISKFFDTVNHNTLVNKLWNMGITDRRLLMIIKSMLKAGVMNESKINELGTPQGRIISPLLANAYLDSMDKWISREWENKETKHKYSKKEGTLRALKKTNLKPEFLIRYADDWLLLTNSKENAEKWKYKVGKYLKDTLKLELSDEKTKITNLRKKPVEFLGFNIKEVIGNSRNGYVSNVKPNKERLERKIEDIRQAIKGLRKTSEQTNMDMLVDNINKVNSMIRGVIQYYQCANNVSVVLNKYSSSVGFTALRNLTPHGAKMVKACETNNLISVHSKYQTTIPAIKYQNQLIGLTSLKFAKWKPTALKNQDETPYTIEGRKLYQTRTNKRRLLARADDLLDIDLSRLIALGLKKPKYNFEYWLNRAYAFNRDEGKCRVCQEHLTKGSIHTHHIDNKLPLDTINKVTNLASVHVECHKLIHGNDKLENIVDKEKRSRVQKFREKLEC